MQIEKIKKNIHDLFEILSQNTLLWIAGKLILSKKKNVLSLQGWISLSGLIIGVGSLFVSMAVISGFETTLQRNLADVVGHIQIYKLINDEESWAHLVEKIKAIDSNITGATPFAMAEAVLASNGKLSGILLQGLDKENFKEVLNIESHLIDGEFKFGGIEGITTAVIGKGIAQDFSLKVGDIVSVVIPLNSEFEVGQFKRKIAKLKVGGILDLGKYEYDQRWIFTSLSDLQKIANIGDKYSGLLLKIKDISKAPALALNLNHELQGQYRVRSWYDINENLFSAIRIEKVVIFFVIFIIVIAAAFNVASSLYINVIRSYPEIAILKALGVTKNKLIKIFSLQGIILGFVGCLFGIVLGLIFCLGFVFIQNQFGIIPGSVYKIDHIDLQIRFLDTMIIVFSTLFICFVATWAPAKKASNLSTIEGLRHD